MTRATGHVAATYPHGVPSWVDLTTSDVTEAQQFYGGLLGWTFTTVTPTGVPPYVVASLDGLDVAALAAEDEGTGWRTYVAVDDADTALAHAIDLGARPLSPVSEVGPAGRAAAIRDPEGCRLWLWEAGRRLGAQVVNEPGAWNFSNLRTTDPVAARRFYGELFGWRYGDMGVATSVMVDGYGEHLAATTYPDILKVQASAPDGFADVVAGLVATDQGAPDAGWFVVITVSDRDAAAAAAQRLGGTVLSTTETAWTAEAVVTDPGGATITLSQFTPPDTW